MTEFLIRLFIKDYNHTSDNKVREQYGKFSGIVGIATNFLLFLIKFVTGFFFHSISIMADAVNNLSDSAASVVTLVGFKMAGKPADQEHPYGHARIEYLAGLIVSLSILLVGFQLGRRSFDKILHPENAEFSLVMLAALLISILIKIWQGMFYKKIGKRIQSETIAATATDSLNDVMATSAVFIGTVITKLTGVNLDGYMGLAVAVLIVITGVKLIQSTSNPLLGTAPTREFVDSIYEKIMSYDGILGIHDLNVHNYGPDRCFASVHCEVSASQDILVSHDIIDNIERDFLTERGIHLVIHLDPIVTDDARTNAVRAQVMQIISQISPEITMHDFRVVWGTTHSNLIFDVCVAFGFQLTDEELKKRLEDEIHKLNPDYHAVVTIDHDYVPAK
ncbi:cation diffusion facilitator family transporter [Caproiciproducens sp. LBM24188]